MSKIVYGSKYKSEMSRVEIAKAIRAEIKSAVKSGALPKAKYSVRCQSYSGGGSIDVAIANVEQVGFELYNQELLAKDRANEWNAGIPWMAESAMELVRKVEAIVKAYNFDGSDSMTDYFHVNFYGSVDFESEYQCAMREAAVAKLKEAA
jgi:hypothetical protein